MKFRTVVILALALVLLLAVAVPVSAGRPTQKIKYAHRSDCGMRSTGTITYEGWDFLAFGDNHLNWEYKAFYKFPLGGIKVNDIDWVEVEFHVLSTRCNNVTDSDAPFPNPGLGDVIVVPIVDYGRIPSSTDYDAGNIAATAVLIPGSDTSVNATVSADVTDAVIAAKTARSRFVTFRLETDTSTDNDSLIDLWRFGTSEALDKADRPRLIVHLKP